MKLRSEPGGGRAEHLLGMIRNVRVDLRRWPNISLVGLAFGSLTGASFFGT